MRGFSEEKNAPFEAKIDFDAKIDKASFCRWVERQERKYEWKEGRVVQMTNVTWAHGQIVTNFVRVLCNALDIDRWSVQAVDFGVETEDAIRYPDIIVSPIPTDMKTRRAPKPAVLVEVLSPTSEGRDFIEKLAEYKTFDALEAYIIASQDEAFLWSWQRQPDGTFPQKPFETAGRDSSLELESRAIALPLAEIYRGITSN